jgi:hypothetical protein
VAIDGIPDEVKEAVFGDGYQITVSRTDGVVVDEYDHD